MKANNLNMAATILLTILLSACAAADPAAQVVEVNTIVTQPVEVTRIVEHTVVVTEQIPVTVIVTATPLPVTPTPIFQLHTSQDAIAAFQAAGLEAENPRPLLEEDYGIAPQVAQEGTRFLIPSLCAECGGRVFSFSSPQNLDILKTYYVTISESSPAFFTWVFEKDNILVQINGDLSEERAREYETALESLK